MHICISVDIPAILFSAYLFFFFLHLFIFSLICLVIMFSFDNSNESREMRESSNYIYVLDL